MCPADSQALTELDYSKLIETGVFSVQAKSWRLSKTPDKIPPEAVAFCRVINSTNCEAI